MHVFDRMNSHRLAWAFVFAGVACAPSRPGTTSTTAASPERMPPPTRTTDNSGFVDNAGRTSDMTARTETSGMRATETGSHRPTGTPGSGVSIPTGPGTESAAGETRLPRGAGLPADVVSGTIGRARCDHELVCERIGPQRRFGSERECLDGVRLPVRADVDRLACASGHAAEQLALCVTAIRQARCDAQLEHIDALGACGSRALCVP
jgi:hypothetical protein